MLNPLEIKVLLLAADNIHQPLPLPPQAMPHLLMARQKLLVMLKQAEAAAEGAPAPSPEG